MKFKWETIKDNPDSALSTVSIKMSAMYFNIESKIDEVFYLIESINTSDRFNQDYMMDLSLGAQKNWEITEEWINWSENYIIDMELNSWNPNNMLNSLLSKWMKTSLYIYGIRLK